MYRVSIIIPVYNVQKHIGRCLESIFAQECSNAEIECIIVDDCSQDDSMEIVAQKLNNYLGSIRFVIKRHSVNCGHCTARNTGLKDAQGDYVLFVDSDDALKSGAISCFIDGLDKFGTNVDVIVCNAFSSRDNKTMMNLGEAHELIDNRDEEGLRRLLAREIIQHSWNKLVKREFLTENALFFDDGIINEDLLWSYLLFRHAKTVLLLPCVTYIYEADNSDSITNTPDKRIQKIITSRITICNKIMSFPPQNLIKDYYTYLFFCFMRALDLFERNRKELYPYRSELYSIRDRLLKDVKDRGFYVLYLFFLTSVKPFYYVTYLRLFRRFFNVIIKKVVTLDKIVQDKFKNCYNK
jgi:glycosyltransferase involved in cell wall biosynthesis